MIKQYFGIADGVNVEGYIDKAHDIILLEFDHITMRNEEEKLVVSMDYHVASKLLKILTERVTLEEE